MFESLIRRNSRDYIALQNLGSIFSKEDSPWYDPQQAVEFFRKSVEANPDHAGGYYNLGREYQKAGLQAEAERAYLETISLSPGYALAHNNLGLLYYHQGKLAEARREYEIALKLDPECGPARFNLNLLEQGPPPEPAPAPPQSPGVSPGFGRHEVPVDQVPPEILLRLYEQVLAKDPTNAEFRKKYDELKSKAKK